MGLEAGREIVDKRQCLFTFRLSPSPLQLLSQWTPPWVRCHLWAARVQTRRLGYRCFLQCPFILSECWVSSSPAGYFLLHYLSSSTSYFSTRSLLPKQKQMRLPSPLVKAPPSLWGLLLKPLPDFRVRVAEQREGEEKEMTSLQEHSHNGPRPMALLLSLTTLPTSLPISTERTGYLGWLW